MIPSRWTAGIPVVPDPDEARRWAEQELAKPEYAQAQPTWFDLAAREVGEFIDHLLHPSVSGGWSGLPAVIAIVVVVVLVVAAILIWGRPRAAHRSRAAVAELFGDDERSAAQLRRDAAARAAEQDWQEAIVLRFRALARGLSERGVVDPVPGATVHAFAREAARAFPAEGPRVEHAATAFDDVRYLRQPGTPALYALVAGVDDALAAARPAAMPDLAELTR
ncbi:MAG: DUF4129 domain-containing protein [Microbacterium sp.]|uniref:DUF4129 domain-containing protein n=1 Tax=Microbacterium sp. TaxID=51671 RepID=UPI0039E6AF70